MSNQLTRVILQNISEKNLKKDISYKRKINLQDNEVNIIKDLINKKSDFISINSKEKQKTKTGTVQHMSLEELVNRKIK